MAKVWRNRRIWCHGNWHFTERVIRLEMTNDPMLHERCDDHPEVCRLDRLQGCMYTRERKSSAPNKRSRPSVRRSFPARSLGRCKFPSKGFRGIVLTCCCSDPTHPTTPKSPGAVAHSFEFATRQLIQTLIPQTRTLCTLKLQQNTFLHEHTQEFRANTLKVQVQV